MTADGVSRVVQRRQVVEDQVRVAYGSVPAILESLPTDHPVRAALRDRARSSLLDCGYLTAEELGTLPVRDALVAVRRRLRDELTRPELVRGVARSGERVAGGSPEPAAVPLTDKPTRV